MSITFAQAAGLLISILGIAGLAIYSGTKPQSFSNINSAPIISGIIMGTLVGGSSTVGTAQLAYSYGLSAWWFTLGGGIACLILGLVYVKPFRDSGCMTIIGIISKEYGPGAGLAASALNTVGTFINIISQLIAGTAVIAVVVPGLALHWSLIISAGFMAIYVIFGGTQGAGRVGILKLVLLYVSMIGCGIMVLALTGGFGGFKAMVAGIDNTQNVNFWSLFSRGFGTDSGACISLILGVLTTQTYAQAVMSGKSDRSARLGALVSAVLIPPIGAGGILVGLYMRANYPGIAAKTALTVFATEHLPGLLCGIVLGTLFIAVVGTGAGLAMGISTIVRRDIVQRFTDKLSDAKRNNRLSRIIILLVLALGVVLSSGSLGDTILSFAFMSMGLRGAVVFVPLCCALWLKGKVHRGFALAAIIAGPLAVLLFGTVLPVPGGGDPLFVGIFAAVLCCAAGLIAGGHRKLVKLSGNAAPDLSKGFVIAMEGELSSTCEELAGALSNKLRVPVYNSEILAEASTLSGIPEKLLSRYESRPVRQAYDLTAESEDQLRLPPTGDLVAAQKAACREIAGKGSCILLNHFAASALEDRPDCVRIFVHESFETRALRCAQERGIGAAAARHALKKDDRGYRRFCRSVSPGWGSASGYTLTINAEVADVGILADSVITYLERLSGERLVRREKQA